MKFPKIRNIKDLLPHIEGNEDIRRNEHSNGTISFNYTTICNSSLFDSMYARECRGITFDAKSGEILTRPFHKFFNIGEREETLPDNINWDGGFSVSPKIDGSICTTTVINGKVTAKSMSSFDSIHAKKMQAYIDVRDGLIDYCLICFDWGMTPIFEFISPEFQIVIPYEKERLVLLKLRDMVTGEYLEHDAVNYHPGDLCINNKYRFGYENIKQRQETETHNEGYVVHLADGTLIKCKTMWYFQLHKFKSTLSERSIAEAVTNCNYDDAKSMMVSMGINTERADEIHDIVIGRIKELKHSANFLFEQYKTVYGRDRRDFAIDNNKKEAFHLAIALIDGKELDLGHYYRKNKLKDEFSNIELVFNNTCSGLAQG